MQKDDAGFSRRHFFAMMFLLNAGNDVCRWQMMLTFGQTMCAYGTFLVFPVLHMAGVDHRRLGVDHFPAIGFRFFFLSHFSSLPDLVFPGINKSSIIIYN